MKTILLNTTIIWLCFVFVGCGNEIAGHSDETAFSSFSSEEMMMTAPYVKCPNYIGFMNYFGKGYAVAPKETEALDQAINRALTSLQEVMDSPEARQESAHIYCQKEAAKNAKKWNKPEPLCFAETPKVLSEGHNEPSSDSGNHNDSDEDDENWDKACDLSEEKNPDTGDWYNPNDCNNDEFKEKYKYYAGARAIGFLNVEVVCKEKNVKNTDLDLP